MLSRLVQTLVLLLLLLAGLCAVAPSAMAMGLTVDSLAEEGSGDCSPTTSCTLPEALELISEGEAAEPEIGGDVTIDFSVSGTILLEHELIVNPGEGVETVTIEGPGAADLKLDGQGRHRGIWISEGNVVISGLTIEKGSATGFAPDGDGGGAIFQDGGTVILEDLHLTENHVESGRGGGAIDFDGGNLTIVGSTIDHNSTDSDTGSGPGGGIYEETSAAGLLTLLDTDLLHNTAEGGRGGGVYQDEGSLSISEGAIADNKASSQGGGVATDADGSRTTTIADSEILDNVSSGEAGGLAAANGSGGVTVTGSTIAGNEAATGGGGIELEEGPLEVRTSTVSGNVVPTESTPGSGDIRAAGISVPDGHLTLDTVTVADNVGGALFLKSGAVAAIRASTIAGNTNPNAQVGGILGEGAATIKSTILAENSGRLGPGDCEVELASEGHNVVGLVGSACHWTGGEGDKINDEPHLGPLADNGGPTATMAPIGRESIAINHGGSSEPTDQRGLTRPVPAGPSFNDVGAVEVQAPVNESAPVISPTADLVEGEELSCDAGRWNTDTITDPGFEYVWRAAGRQIDEGTTHELTAADAGKELICRVTADDGATTATADSAAVELLPGTASLAPPSLAFGARNIGAGPSPAQSLILTNSGGTAVTVTSVAGSDPIQFPVQATACTAGGGVLAPGAQCEIEVSFDPAQTGAVNATVTVQTSAGQAEAALSGTGTAPGFEASPASLDFGPRQIGAGPGPTQVFTVTNAGTGPMSVGTVAVTGADAPSFAIPPGQDGCSGEMLQVGRHCTVAVDFEPATAGAQSASLSFPGDAPGEVPLLGTGAVAELAASPAEISFGSVAAGSGPTAPQTVTISNRGSVAVALGEPILGGPGRGQFEISADECAKATLAAEGGSCRLVIGFLAAATGALEATLQVPPVGAGEPAVTLLKGTVSAPPAPPSAKVGVTPRHVLVANAAGELIAPVRCESAAGQACQMTLTLLQSGAGGTASASASVSAPAVAPLGGWSGTVAAGTEQRVAVPLSRAGRKVLGRSGKLRALLVLTTAGGTGSSTPLTLAASPAPTLSVQSVGRAGDSLAVALRCSGTPRCSGHVSIAVPGLHAPLATGEVSVRSGRHVVRLKLSAAGGHLLEGNPRPRLLATAIAVDRVYGRSTARRSRLQLR